MKSFFERSGIYGYHYADERAMLASLVTGTPVLLMGKIGEAKTMAAELMAMLLLGDRSKFLKIAADKAQFEDMIGFPSPKAMQESRIEFIKSGTTIWDREFVLVDEISRCNPQLQNKFLEVLLEREIMGIATGVGWIWATMNPLSYAGSQPLDGALAGRMGYVISVPETAYHKKDETIEKIISSRHHAQTPALSYWLGEAHAYKHAPPAELGEELRDLLKEAAKVHNDLVTQWTTPVAKYLTAFVRSLTQSNTSLDGRRLVMMKENIISNIAVQTIQTGRALNINEIVVVAKEVVPRSIPWLASGGDVAFDQDKFMAAHAFAAPFLEKGDSLVYRVLTEQDPIEKLRLYLENRHEIDELTAISLVRSLFNKPRRGSDAQETLRMQATAYAVQLAATYAFMHLPGIPVEAIGHSAKNYPAHMFEPNQGNLIIRSQSELDDILYRIKTARDTGTQREWAAINWAFYPSENVTRTYQEALDAYSIVLEILEQVATTIAPTLRVQEEDVDHAQHQAADLLTGLFESDETSEDSEGPALELSAGGLTI